MRHLPFIPAALAAVVLCSFRSAEAQAPNFAGADVTSAAADHSPPRFSTGVTAGALSFTGGRTEQALSALLQFRPVPWLSLSAAPGFGRTTFGTGSSNGLTDIPLASSAQYLAPGLLWSPTVFGALSTVLSTGSAGSTLGVGRSSVVVTGGLSFTPRRGMYLSADASEPLTPATGNGSADVAISRSLGRTTPSLGFSAETGRPDSAATLARSVAAGVAFSVAGPLTLALDGSRGITTGAPKWAISMSFGTAFSGISSVSGGLMFGRLKNAFGSRAASSSGYTKTPTGGTSCKKIGTC